MANRIPAKQVVRRGTASDLMDYMLDREIGFCDDNGCLCLKVGGGLLYFPSMPVLKDGGTLVDGASVSVPNNAVSTLSSLQSALTLNVTCGEGEVPNFAVEVAAGATITLTVTKTVGSTTTTLKYSEAAGNELESGKYYQVTCVGNCWTLAEFVSPS